MKTAERSEARRLRRDEGRSIKEIAALVGVSPSSVSAWVRDIELTPEQHETLARRNPAQNPQRASHAASRARALDARRKHQDHGRRLAMRRDAFHAAGCMLYWAEGSKSRNQAQLTNSDPELLRFFARFLRVYFAVPDDKFRVACNLHADHAARQRGIEDYWLTLLELPRSCLTKSTVNVYSKYSEKKRRNLLPYGTCRVTICCTRIVQSIYGAIQEYAGFEREEWLW